LIELAIERDINMRFIPPCKLNQNAFIEGLNPFFRVEVLDAHLFDTLSEAKEAAETCSEGYNEYRPN